jgi:hypothetical protein
MTYRKLPLTNRDVNWPNGATTAVSRSGIARPGDRIEVCAALGLEIFEKATAPALSAMKPHGIHRTVPEGSHVNRVEPR